MWAGSAVSLTALAAAVCLLGRFFPSAWGVLSVREREVLILLAKGLPYKQIADRLLARLLGFPLALVPRGPNSSCRWPRDDDEAVIAGTGTNLGDTITARKEGSGVPCPCRLVRLSFSTITWYHL